METKLSILLQDKGSAVHTVAPDATVLDAVRRMNEAGVGSLLVMNGDELVGIFTERDVLRRVVDSDLDAAATRIAKVMTRDLVTVGPGATVAEAMTVVTEKRCRHLPVCEEGRLLGVVSSGDLTRWATRSQATHIQDLVNYITGKYPG
jgi:CBS domain-containing protein